MASNQATYHKDYQYAEGVPTDLVREVMNVLKENTWITFRKALERKDDKDSLLWEDLKIYIPPESIDFQVMEPSKGKKRVVRMTINGTEEVNGMIPIYISNEKKVVFIHKIKKIAKIFGDQRPRTFPYKIQVFTDNTVSGRPDFVHFIER